jgi:hypothetical protein
MNSEQYENLIALLKKALEFYADQRNYDGPMGNISSISLDEYGSQARFALEKIKELQKMNDEMQSDYIKNAETMMNNMKDEELAKEIIDDLRSLGLRNHNSTKNDNRI